MTRRYHSPYREDDDHENLQILPSTRRKTSRRTQWRCKRPPALFLLIWAAFVFLLSINFFSLSRDPLPDVARWIGWQEFASLGSISASSPAAISLDDSLASQAQTDGQEESSHSSSSSSLDGPAYPSDVYAPLLPNPAPLTEVTVQDCSPVRLDQCKPRSTPEEDAVLGRWVLVPRPLDSEAAQSLNWSKSGIGGALNKLWGALDTRYIFYRRSRKGDAPRIVDIRLVETGQDPPNGGTEEGWFRVKNDLRSPYMRLWGGKVGLHLYYKLDRSSARAGLTRSNGSSEAEREEALDPITELDVLYGGGNTPWPGFSIVGEIMPHIPSLAHAGTYLVARRKPMPNPPLDAQPRFHRDGTFKILQLADLHFSVEEEPCRAVGWESKERPCHSSNDTMALIGRWLDDEKPDLVVFTGDQLNGQGTSWDPRSAAYKIFLPVIERKIQWAAILGNHDSQSGPLSRPEVQQLFTRLPYSLSRIGPSHLHDGRGAGNYYIQLTSPTPDRTNVFNLYFLDSGDVEKSLAWGIMKSYDWIRQDQIDWFVKQSGKMKKILRPYKPDGGVDLPAQNWQRGDTSPQSQSFDPKRGPSPAGQVWDAGAAQGQLLAKPNAITFVHIPLPEFFDNATSTVRFGPDRMETSGKKGSQGQRGFYDALLGQGTQGERDVRLVVSGHMHNNADCELIEKEGQSIWMCFAGGSSYAGYGMLGFDRRCRVFQLSNFGETAHSWNRFEDGSKVLEGTLWDDLTHT